MDNAALVDDLGTVAFTTTTPFGDDGEAILHDELRANVEFIQENGATVLVPCGNTGEYYSLTADERIDVVRTVADAADEDARVIAGAGGSTKTVLSLTRAYEDAGVDAVMIMHPRHTYIHRRGLEAYYRRIAETTDLGVVVYVRGPEISSELIATLTEIDNVVAIKYAINDVDGFSDLRSTATGNVAWLTGIAERFALAYAVEGAEGFTTGIGNFIPRTVLALQNALEREAWDEAREIRDAVRPFEKLRAEAGPGNDLSAANNVPSVKAALKCADRYGGPVREPIVPLSAEDQARVEEEYDRILSLGYEA